MNDALHQESKKLAGSWMKHDRAMLRDYLVSDVEDPRINVQSMLTRHFLASEIFGNRFDDLATAELQFAAALNWLIPMARKAGHPELLADVDYALSRGADEIEGIELPYFVRTLFASLPREVGGVKIPNYISQFLQGARSVDGQLAFPQPVLETFQTIWSQLRGLDAPPLSVFEPACGSANDYRFLHSYGLSRWLDYTGLDICEKNIANARELFPKTKFEVGNVFEIQAPDKAFDSVFTHDLLEHLSPEGIEAAVDELCRVTRRSMCLHFFNMDEIPADQVQPVEDYHWNCLSVIQMRERFVRRGLKLQIIHIGEFLRAKTLCESTHNLGAYTFIIR